MPAVYGSSTSTAAETTFDNSTNGFAATNVQDAIQEAVTLSSYNINLVLVDNHFDVLADNEGNLLEGIL